MWAQTTTQSNQGLEYTQVIKNSINATWINSSQDTVHQMKKASSIWLYQLVDLFAQQVPHITAHWLNHT